ncbi:3-coathanger stack domain-containing protein [Emticicia sp. SJ17W-69]|uniref:3-coathanger stack domain-containing protein n=1 Tax=Emticicia sp. SJ17W-69 TaxID=3421657 RepID=UPI003EB732A6
MNWENARFKEMFPFLSGFLCSVKRNSDVRKIKTYNTKSFLLTFIFIWGFKVLFAQNITLTQAQYTNYCVGTTISIQGYLSNGGFNSNNVFRASFRQVYNDSIHYDLPARFENGTFQVEIPVKYASNENLNYLNVSIYSSSPYKVSNEINVLIKYLPRVKFEGFYQYVITQYSEYIKTNYIAPNQSLFIRLKSNGYNFSSNSIKVIFNSGAIIQPTYGEIYFNPKQENYTYKVDSVRNECGYGLIEPAEHTLNVMPYGLEITNFSSMDICKGQKIYINYNSSYKFEDHTNWKLEILNNEGINVKTLDLAYENSQLSTIIPTDITPNGYFARIITSTPNIYSNIFGKLNIYEQSDIQIFTPNLEVYPQEKVQLVYNYTGAKPNSYILNDSLHVVPFGGNTGLNYYYQFKPTYQGIYRFTNVLSNCGNKEINREFNIRIKDDLELFDLPNKSFCVGEKFKVRFKAKSYVNLSSLEVRAYNYNTHSNYTIFAHTIIGDSLEIQIPSEYYYSDGTQFRLVTSNNEYQSNFTTNNIRIKSIPSANISYTGNYQISNPEYVSIYLNLNGGWPYYVKSTNDTITNIIESGNSSFSTFIKNPVSIKLQSIKNQCGVGIIGQEVNNYTLYSRPNSLRIVTLNKNIFCLNDPIIVQIDTIGKYNSDNEFQLFLATSYRSDSLLGKSKSINLSGRMTNKISMSETFYVKVCSTSPASCTYGTYIKLNAFPVGGVTSAYVYNNDLLPYGESVNTNIASLIKNQQISLISSFYGSGTLYYRINNSKIYTIGAETYDLSTYGGSDLIRIQKDTTFSITEVKNECGINTNSSPPFNVKVVKFKIYTSELLSYRNCVGGALSVTYRLEGEVPTDANFAVQMKSNNEEFRTIETLQNGNPMVVKIPEDIKDGAAYNFRVICTNYSDFESTRFSSTYLYKRPSAKLVSANGTDSVFVYKGGESISLKVQLKGDNGKGVVFNPSNRYVPFSDSVGYFPVIAKPGDIYSLKSVQNSACGYGDVLGIVKVYERPSIIINNIVFSSLCVGSSVSINFQTTGEFGKNNVIKAILVDTYNNQYTVATTTQSNGDIVFNTPNNIRHGYYQIFLRATNPNLTTTFSGYHYLSEPPNLNLTGTTYINPGQNSEIIFKVSKGTSPITVTFEDNSQATLSYYNNSINYEPISISKPLAPTITSVYKVKSVSNICGDGIGSGQAVINVNTATGNYINTKSVPLVCSGKNLKIPFQKIGNIPNTLTYWAEMSDENSENYQIIPSKLLTDTISAIIPQNLAVGSNYRFRVRVNDNNIQSSSSPNGVALYFPNQVSFEDSVILKQKQSYVIVPIKITGTLPVDLIFKHNNVLTYSSVYSNTFSYFYYPDNFEKSDSLQIISATNICGVGTNLNPNKARIVFCKNNADLIPNIIENQQRYFEVNGEIISTNKIKNLSKINFDSGKTIILNPGFEVQSGSVFKAIIDGCPGKINAEN